MKTKAAGADRFVIIMAGGKGERFWPVSRDPEKTAAARRIAIGTGAPKP